MRTGTRPARDSGRRRTNSLPVSPSRTCSYACIVGAVAADLAFLIQDDHLSSKPAVRADVVEDEAVDAHEQTARLEAQPRIPLEAGGEVVPHCRLSDELALSRSREDGDERRRQLEVVGVEAEDALEVVRVPGVVPR